MRSLNEQRAVSDSAEDHPLTQRHICSPVRLAAALGSVLLVLFVQVVQQLCPVPACFLGRTTGWLREVMSICRWQNSKSDSSV